MTIRVCFNCKTDDSCMWRRAYCGPGEYICNACYLYAKRHGGSHRPLNRKQVPVNSSVFKPIAKIILKKPVSPAMSISSICSSSSVSSDTSFGSQSALAVHHDEDIRAAYHLLYLSGHY